MGVKLAAQTLAADVAARLGGTIGVAGRAQNPLKRMARSAIGGRSAGVELVVSDGHPLLRTFSVELPAADDIVAPVVADAIATAVGIRRRFGRAIDALRSMSFDLHDGRMASGHIAGTAYLNLGVVHLNAAYVTASGIAEQQRRTGQPPIPMDALVAHELWHLIELAWETRDYAATIAFRRDLGAHFGVATIEHAVRGDEDANAHLRDAVSWYAATGSREATAEMFQQWWVAGEISPAIAHFAAAVDRYLPPPSS